jgi:hypothetical protein
MADELGPPRKKSAGVVESLLDIQVLPVQGKSGSALKKADVDQGLDGTQPG